MMLNQRDFAYASTKELRDLVFKATQELAYRRDRKKEDKLIPIIYMLQPLIIPKNAKATEHNEIIRKYNGDNLLSLPIFPDIHERATYLSSLLDQDWSFLYAHKDHNTEPKFYVYAHVRPSRNNIHLDEKHGGDYGGMPFYIGKGTGSRVTNFRRGDEHSNMLRTLGRSGSTKDDIAHILFDNLTESKALEIEAKLIYFFGAVHDRSRGCSTLINFDLPIIPQYINGAMTHYKVFDENEVIEEEGTRKKLKKKPRKTKK